MVKHNQTIRRILADELFEYVWPFCVVGFKGFGMRLDAYSELCQKSKMKLFLRT